MIGQSEWFAQGRGARRREGRCRSRQFKRFLALLAAGLGLSLSCGWGAALPQKTAVPDLAQRLSCFACHAAGPGHLAAPLNGVGSRLTREELQVALTQPRKLHPGAKMPSYTYLPEGERQALLDFLSTLK